MTYDREAHDTDEAPASTLSIHFSGIAGSPGIGLGEVCIIGSRRRVEFHTVNATQVDAELDRFKQAAAHAGAQLRELVLNSRNKLSAGEASILEAYALMVVDPLLEQRVSDFVRLHRACAEWALEAAAFDVSRELSGASDRYLRERSRDIEFVGELIHDALEALCSSGAPATPQYHGVVVARQLSPTQVAAIDPSRVAAVVTESGTATSHTAIVARALGVPAVVGCPGVVEACTAHALAIVDGRRGIVTLSPNASEVSAAEDRRDQRRKALAGLRSKAQLGAARTRCGTQVQLQANTEFPYEVELAISEGAGGIGLYRTEFLCVDRGGYPSEEEQFHAYRTVLDRAGKRPVTFRTFDLGGDKAFVGPRHEHSRNPALGRRGIRWGFSEPDVFMTQLRALRRASAHGDVRVMVPMVTTVDEFAAARAMFHGAGEQVRGQGHAQADKVPFGCMIEVPAAALMAEQIAREAEFLAVGTNDLVQYTCAVDRADPRFAALNNPLLPAVMELIERVVQGAASHKRPVSVCGAMASDPQSALLLIALGVRNLSMEAGALQAVREVVGRVSLVELQGCLEQARAATSAAAVEAILTDRFGDYLADLREI